ncbi:hypothetical protein BIY21_21030 [Vibrio ponticus]|uniref:Uncharacterized protein n=1 Tax=Vibrio ponticus TaxID=265668 RepID=A0ABX3FQD4_9VIBR|nr:hypothetical protein BIY21_21030 [Vibrio ponticus]
MDSLDSQTQIFYKLLDLDDEHKQSFLEKLQQDNPALYADVICLVNADADADQHLTKILGFNLSFASSHKSDLTHQQIDKYLICILFTS